MNFSKRNVGAGILAAAAGTGLLLTALAAIPFSPILVAGGIVALTIAAVLYKPKDGPSSEVKNVEQMPLTGGPGGLMQG